MGVQNDIAYLRTFIKREKRMRESVLRGPDREDKIVQCIRALDALDAIEAALQDAAVIERQDTLFGEGI